MSLDLALSAARSGLSLINRQLARAADDIANADTEGHTRKRLDGAALTAGGTGIGVRAMLPQREVDQALVAAMDTARGARAAAAERERLLSGIEAAHGRVGDGASLGGLMAGLRGAFVALREAPADRIGQRGVVEAADGLARQLNGLSAAVGSARQAAQDGMAAEVRAVNEGLAEIARLTGSIRVEMAAGRSTAALDDRRDAAIARLSESLAMQVLRKSDGGVVLVARGGLVLPLDEHAPALAFADATVGPEAHHGGTGTLPGVMLGGVDLTRRLAGGRLGALAELRDATLPRMAAELDQSAAHLAARMDAQGLRLFSDGAGGLPDMSIPYHLGAKRGFAGVIQVNPAVAAAPALVRDGTHAVAGLPGGPTAFAPNPAGGPAGFGLLLDRVLGFAFGAEAAPGVPQPPIESTGLGPDGTLASPLAGLVTLEAHAGALVATQAGLRAAAGEGAAREGAMLDLLAARFAERSGVDVDREMAAMVQLQTAYGVNARVLSTAQAMWDALFGAVR
jgi:flagellar hook-associated protein 1 FlgK